jgi:RimJ/RimL family protein N-acetyltransferase
MAEKMEKVKYEGNAKIFFEKTFTAADSNLEIGRFILVNYFGSEKMPHLEFEIFNEFKEYRNRGIVSKEIVKYLKLCKEHGHNRLVAIVKEDNLASMRILEKNNFIRFSQLKENVCFVIDLKFTKKKLMAMQEVIYERQNLTIN